MSEEIPATVSRPPTASASEFIATFAALVGAVLLFLALDVSLARLDRAENTSHARNEYRQGMLLLGKGKVAEAIERLRTASVLDHEASAYPVSLAEAMLAAGRPGDAEQMLTPVLERDATDGAANLTIARVLEKEGRFEQAKAYYHRAIYGVWRADSTRNRAVARFALIDLLARTNDKQELLGELLPIQDDSVTDLPLRKRIAQLFILAGSASRAAAIYRDVLHRSSGDVDALAGLGEAAIALGDYRAARADLRSALRFASDRDSAAIRSRLDIMDSLIAMDPTQRGLDLREQYARSRNLVQLTIVSVRSCPVTNATHVAATLDSATKALLARASGVPRDEAIDENLSSAVALWRLRREKCATSPGDGALETLQRQLGQQKFTSAGG
jgi:tetratricopeptide (TPR) repeat protein